MPAAYSDDLRCKAIAAVERGVPQKDVCDMFNVSRSSLSLWIK
ncbi:helix-turn-helix domain-containing protein [[Leptolyngbya] sp. PCC 7376]|nr:helix-turn-helix domain-containing protein [[Leptolyngbya] sp. PCC 7376]